MEPKQIKKLMIKQEVISNLNEGSMVRLKGGTSGSVCDSCYPPDVSRCFCSLNLTDCNCPDDTEFWECNSPCATADQEICRDSDRCDSW